MEPFFALFSDNGLPCCFWVQEGGKSIACVDVVLCLGANVAYVPAAGLARARIFARTGELPRLWLIWIRFRRCSFEIVLCLASLSQPCCSQTLSVMHDTCVQIVCSSGSVSLSSAFPDACGTAHLRHAPQDQASAPICLHLSYLTPVHTTNCWRTSRHVFPIVSVVTVADQQDTLEEMKAQNRSLRMTATGSHFFGALLPQGQNGVCDGCGCATSPFIFNTSVSKATRTSKVCRTAQRMHNTEKLQARSCDVVKVMVSLPPRRASSTATSVHLCGLQPWPRCVSTCWLTHVGSYGRGCSAVLVFSLCWLDEDFVFLKLPRSSVTTCTVSTERVDTHGSKKPRKRSSSGRCPPSPCQCLHRPKQAMIQWHFC